MSDEPNIQISDLADAPEYLPVLAAWIYQEWHQHRPGGSMHATAAQFRSHLQCDAIPLTLIARRDSKLVGTASIYVTDMNTRPELGPWLAAVYVPPEWRGMGIGSELVGAIEDRARRLGIGKLYLFTPDRERFYTRLGWTMVETTFYDDHPVVIMAKALSG